MIKALGTSRLLLSETELLHLKTWLRPVDECLWAKLEDQRSNLDRIKATPGLAATDSELVRSCQERIEMARWCIERRGHSHAAHGSSLRKHLEAWIHRFRWPATEDNTLFWHLAHSVDEDLLLLLPVEEVAVRGLEIKSLFERNIKQAETKKVWLEDGGDKAPLTAAVRSLTEAAKTHGPEDVEIRQKRQVLRRALHEVNDQTDQRFRQLAVNMLMRAWSGFLLFVLLVPSALILPDYLREGIDSSGAMFSPALLILGAAGAVLANLMSKDAFRIAQGPARRYLFYYLFAKPVQGAFAALTLYLVLKSGLLFTLGAKGEQATFAFATLALAAGFTAEKIFGTMINKSLERLFKVAEKTETTPAPTGEPSEREG